MFILAPFIRPAMLGSAEDFVVYLPIVAAAIALLCLYAAHRAMRRRRLVQDLPTSTTAGVFIGLVELKGTAEVERPLVSHLTELRCVYYQWSVAEQWSRIVTETYTDSKGNIQTRTRTESGWTTLASGGEQIPFYLRDGEGVVLVHPAGAHVEPSGVLSKTCGRSDPFYYGKGPSHSIPNSDHRRRFVETAILLHADLYVVGQAREREDIVAPEIAHDSGVPLFLISTRTEKQVARGYGWSYGGWALFAGVLWLGSFVVVDLVRNRDLAKRWAWYVPPALGYLLAIAIGWVWGAYNSLVDLRQRMRQGWAQIDVQLKRRADLIPNLVQIVSTQRDYERNVQTELAHLRSQLTATAPGQPGPDFQACASQLIAVAERYPELKSDEAFRRLQESLVDTEHRIALARGYYNEIATYWNTRMESIPDGWLARPLGMRPQPLLAAADFERQAVEVQFAE